MRVSNLMVRRDMNLSELTNITATIVIAHLCNKQNQPYCRNGGFDLKYWKRLPDEHRVLEQNVCKTCMKLSGWS